MEFCDNFIDYNQAVSIDSEREREREPGDDQVLVILPINHYWIESSDGLGKQFNLI